MVCNNRKKYNPVLTKIYFKKITYRLHLLIKNHMFVGYLDIEGPPLKEMLMDRRRVKYHHDHLMALKEAIQ